MELLKDMAIFVEVARARSFRGAAEAVGMPGSTLSRRIGALEKAIGLRLFHRTTRKIELTEAGRIYFERCRRIVSEARLAREHLGDMLTRPGGLLRASLPADFAVTHFARLIAEFARQYPDITFDFDFSPRHVDLVSEPFDVAIRMGRPEPAEVPVMTSGAGISGNLQLIARSLVSLTPALYAAPEYLERAGEPAAPADLERHECLNILKTGVWTLSNGAKTVTASAKGRFTLNNANMIRRLATLGMGIILMPETIVAGELREGRLRRVLPEWRGAPLSVYALTETRLLPAKTQCFIAFLRERLPQALAEAGAPG
ncbi:MAG: LysR family transcriptional regulator [Zoogloeaceae bacterium]|jgi:DNA-binding transcriptional LysR family regulator|nr:LysR family transcriptional regulator [Zoogloeaceae bacterium]